MVHLAKNEGKILSLAEISKAEGIPFNFLEKIILRLEKKKLVKSKKGVNGGYFLAKNARKIKIGEIINILEGEIVLVKCLKRFCSRSNKCSAKNFWKKLNRAFNVVLNSINLADLIK